MLSKRPCRVIESLDCRIGRFHPRRSAQCLRRFHATNQDRAGASDTEIGIGPGSPIDAPKRGPSRHQRAAKVSNEISMLQRGPPPSGELSGPGSVTGTYHAPPQAPTSGAGFLETPTSSGGDTMGDNVTLGREGPNAQGIGRLVKYDDQRTTSNDTTKHARGVKIRREIEEPSEGGASVFNVRDNTSAHHPEWLKRSARGPGKGEATPMSWSQDDARRLKSRLASVRPAGSPYQPRDLGTESDFLRRTYGSQTMAGNNFRGIIRDKCQTFLTPMSPSTALLSNKPWSSVPERVTGSLVERMVAGQYQTKTPQDHSNPVLDMIKTKLDINGSYLPRDGDKLLAKVRSILPQATSASGKTPSRQKT